MIGRRRLAKRRGKHAHELLALQEPEIGGSDQDACGKRRTRHLPAAGAVTKLEWPLNLAGLEANTTTKTTATTHRMHLCGHSRSRRLWTVVALDNHQINRRHGNAKLDGLLIIGRVPAIESRLV